MYLCISLPATNSTSLDPMVPHILVSSVLYLYKKGNILCDKIFAICFFLPITVKLQILACY